MWTLVFIEKMLVLYSLSYKCSQSVLMVWKTFWRKLRKYDYKYLYKIKDLARKSMKYGGFNHTTVMVRTLKIKIKGKKVKHDVRRILVCRASRCGLIRAPTPYVWCGPYLMLQKHLCGVRDCGLVGWNHATRTT